VGHGRVFAGTFDDHVSTIAHRWAAHTAKERTVAVVASTNEHVDALNAAIQQLRIDLGQLDADTSAGIAGGERAMIGDHVVTRRNDRRIVTDHGEPIRNRELWTVTDIGHDGSLTVTANRGHATAVLPVEYIHDHVRLGYAATEHGVQGDTTTIGIELVSTATTRRGAYVGLTRGRDDNTVLVVTDSHDLDEARDVLDRIVTIDRADIPATTQRRELAVADRNPRRPPPRWEVPDWLPTFGASITNELAAVEARFADAQTRLSMLRSQLPGAEHHLAVAERQLDPYRPAIDRAAADAKAAQERMWTAHNRSLHLKGRQRRAAEHEHQAATLDRDVAKQREAHARSIAQPATDAVSAAAQRVHEIRQSIENERITLQWTAGPEQVREHRSLRAAVDEWERWANGRPVAPARLTAMIDTLRSDFAAERTECAGLAAIVDEWANAHGVDLTPTSPKTVERSAGIEL
jgi:hypothetical protein